MNILIIGAAGMVGRKLTSALIARKELAGRQIARIDLVDVVVPEAVTGDGIAIAVQAVAPMIAMALDRRFTADLGAIGQALGVLVLVGNLASLPIAWWLDRVLRKRMGMRARPAIMGVATAISIPCAALLAFAPSAASALALTGAFLFATCIANALIPTMLQDLAPGDVRARAFASYSFLIAAFCALGPLLSGGLSQYALSNDLLSAISLAAVPVLLVTVACTTLWCRDARTTAPPA